MKNISTVNLRFLVILFILITVGCIHRTQELSYELIDERSLQNENTMTPWPELIIIANENEITPPAGLDFAEETYKYLRDFEFERSFAILWEVRQIPDSGTVKEIIRENDAVVIRINPYITGPGDYLLLGWTFPFQLIRITKDGEWNRDIQFKVEDADGNVVKEITHFIP